MDYFQLASEFCVDSVQDALGDNPNVGLGGVDEPVVYLRRPVLKLRIWNLEFGTRNWKSEFGTRNSEIKTWIRN